MVKKEELIQVVSDYGSDFDGSDDEYQRKESKESAAWAQGLEQCEKFHPSLSLC